MEHVLLPIHNILWPMIKDVPRSILEHLLWLITEHVPSPVHNAAWPRTEHRLWSMKESVRGCAMVHRGCAMVHRTHSRVHRKCLVAHRTTPRTNSIFHGSRHYTHRTCSSAQIRLSRALFSLATDAVCRGCGGITFPPLC